MKLNTSGGGSRRAASVALSLTWLLCVNAEICLCQLQSQAAGNETLTTTSTQKPANYLETSKQISGILDRFMHLGYDKRVRPNYGGPPVEVNVTMRILSISSVSEVMMDFTADFYFRQTWHDPRLAFKKLGDIQTLYVGAEVSKKIWLPDTFFGNEKLAYFHEATTPNVFLRIDHSGEVYRSIRLTVTSSCPMNLQYFPMDRQRCTIEAESYGYNVKDIIYRWARKDTAVERDKEISLPQFDIVKTVQKYRLEELSSGTYSRLIAEIHFARRMGYYLIQIYIPSSLIVVISWVSFWLHRNASPARVQLGVTTVLTMTTLMSSTNAALPKISYVKSIDIFLGTCFIMVFAALLEYATVGYLGKRIAMRKAQLQHAQSQAQARLFAQLQAQGAQGDLVPPTASAASMAGASVPQIFGPSPGEPSAPAVAPPCGALQQQQSSSLLSGTSEAHRQAALLSQLANDLAAQSGATTEHEQLAGQLGLLLAKPALDSPTPQPPARNFGPRACCGGGAHLQHNRHACCAGGNHGALSAARNCSGCPTGGSQPKLTQTNSCPFQCKCAQSQEPPFEVSSRTLPRNFHHHQHQHHHNNQDCESPQAQAVKCCAPPQPPPTRLCSHQAALAHHQHHHYQPQSHAHLQQQQPEAALKANLSGLPPSYCPAGLPKAEKKGAAAATAAAAATFVNLHRRNKGLPPSTNPNFARFAWMGQYDRSIETIFGIRPSDIDKYSRVVFPVCFVCFQLMYWIVYLHISAFLESEQQQQQPVA